MQIPMTVIMMLLSTFVFPVKAEGEYALIVVYTPAAAFSSPVMTKIEGLSSEQKCREAAHAFQFYTPKPVHWWQIDPEGWHDRSEYKTTCVPK